MASTRRRSLRLSIASSNKPSEEVTVLSTSKRRVSLISKNDRQVLSAESSDEEKETAKRKIAKKSPIKRRSAPVNKLTIKEIMQEESSDESDEPELSEDVDSEGEPEVKKERSEDSFDSSGKENHINNAPAKKKKQLPKVEITDDESKKDSNVSEFEALRRKNIEERMKMFQQLNLGELKGEMEAKASTDRKVPARKSSLFSDKSQPIPAEAVRKSARLQGFEAKKLELPPEREIREEYPEYRRKRVTTGGKVSLFQYEGDWDNKPRNSEPVISLDKALHRGFRERDNSKLLLDCCMRMCLSKEEDQEFLTPERCSLQEFKKNMENLTLQEQHKMKVVPSRIYSMAMSPLTHGFLVAAGCKSGAVGLWNINPERTEWDDSQVVAFNYHSRPTNCITFGTKEPNLMYTTSYDGTIRRVDLQKQDFSLVYETPTCRKDNHTCWHVEIEPRILLLGVGDGSIAQLDTRQDNTNITTFRCHDRSLRTISVHPGTNQHLATTSSFNKEVAIWDLRKMSSKRAFSGKLASIDFQKPLSSAFFSPVTGNTLLTTSADDKIGVYNCTDLGNPTLIHKQSHNNHTGRWITNFRATWHPKREDVFVIGSMDRPDRKLEIFEVNPKIKMMTTLMDDEYFTTIGAVTVFHPYTPAVAAGNASGYVHVFL